MFEKVILGVTAVVVMLLILLLMQIETTRLKNANEAMLRDMRGTRHILETAATEIDNLRDECARLHKELDEASGFISKLRAEVMAQSLETKSERDL